MKLPDTVEYGWEYKFLWCSHDQSSLNELGKIGWEVHSFVPDASYDTPKFIILLKRPLQWLEGSSEPV